MHLSYSWGYPCSTHAQEYSANILVVIFFCLLVVVYSDMDVYKVANFTVPILSVYLIFTGFFPLNKRTQYTQCMGAFTYQCVWSINMVYHDAWWTTSFSVYSAYTFAANFYCHCHLPYASSEEVFTDKIFGINH